MEEYLKEIENNFRNIYTEEKWNIFKSNNWRRLHGLPLIPKHKIKKYKLYKEKESVIFDIIEKFLDDKFFVNCNENLYQSFIECKDVHHFVE